MMTEMNEKITKIAQDTTSSAPGGNVMNRFADGIKARVDGAKQANVEGTTSMQKLLSLA